MFLAVFVFVGGIVFLIVAACAMVLESERGSREWSRIEHLLTHVSDECGCEYGRR